MEVQRPLEDFEVKLVDKIKELGADCEHLLFEDSCHSVEEAAAAAGEPPAAFIKSVCLMGNGLIVAIVSGVDRVSTTRVGEILGIASPRIATADEVLAATGFPVGGVPPFGYPAVFLIDETVMEREVVLGGGGSTKALTKMSPKEIQRLTNGQVARVRK